MATWPLYAAAGLTAVTAPATARHNTTANAATATAAGEFFGAD